MDDNPIYRPHPRSVSAGPLLSGYAYVEVGWMDGGCQGGGWGNGYEGGWRREWRTWSTWRQRACSSFVQMTKGTERFLIPLVTRRLEGGEWRMRPEGRVCVWVCECVSV